MLLLENKGKLDYQVELIILIVYLEMLIMVEDLVEDGLLEVVERHILLHQQGFYRGYLLINLLF